LIATLAIGLSGCTDSDTPTTTPPTDTSLRPIRVAALPIAETAALWGAIAAGIFTKHGLEVEVLPAQGGALAIPALANGDLDIAIGQPFGPFRADLQDLGVVIIGNYASSYATGDDINAVIASKASGITRPRDLAGRKVSVNSLGAAGDVTIMESVAKDGGDPSTIEFVEVAFPDVAASRRSASSSSSGALGEEPEVVVVAEPVVRDIGNDSVYLEESRLPRAKRRRISASFVGR
jgi:NitT/TauT family transport system substrate-binding protein